ncbi:regulation of response to stimulus [Desmophyllum pertusum]|uniref:Regulation of response to stimulus n=1 Tax=Desmophyllum pertusum TaxID=174260 RepID=A0A9W9Z3E9_9CNID|nr:regulation of response to stimulus [Desmophyllum pertusum]
MASGFYAVAHAQARPIPDKFEHLLQLASLVATFFNLSVGVLLRIPSEMVNYSIEKDKDSVGVTILLVTANVMVIGLIVIRYLLSLGQSLYSVYKTPQCNWECCLSVFLSAQDTNDNLEDATEDGDDFAVYTMEISAGDMRMLDLGVANDVTGNIDGEEIDREPKDVEERSEATSGYDGRESPGRFQSPGGTRRQGATGPSVGMTGTLMEKR